MTSHGHDHDGDHSHLTETEARVRALESLLSAKGYIDSAAVDRIIQTYETKIGPRNVTGTTFREGMDPREKPPQQHPL